MFRLKLKLSKFFFQNPVFILHGSSSSDLQTYLDTRELGFAKDHIVIQAIIRETLYAGSRGITKGTYSMLPFLPPKYYSCSLITGRIAIFAIVLYDSIYSTINI